RGMMPRSGRRFGVDVGGHDEPGAEAARGHGEQRRSRAEVERATERAALGEARQRFETELRRLVRSGAECATRVDDQALGVRAVSLPAGDDLEAPDPERPEAFPEASDP